MDGLRSERFERIVLLRCWSPQQIGTATHEQRTNFALRGASNAVRSTPCRASGGVLIYHMIGTLFVSRRG
jgi:hypothetical protein